MPLGRTAVYKPMLSFVGRAFRLEEQAASAVVTLVNAVSLVSSLSGPPKNVKEASDKAESPAILGRRRCISCDFIRKQQLEAVGSCNIPLRPPYN